MTQQTVIGSYRVRADAEPEFIELLGRHRRTLRELGFVINEPAMAYRKLDDTPTYAEIFTWVEDGYQHAREHPAVLAIWGAMDPLLENRDELPRWDFPHYQRVALGT